ncbi:diguanylate cyclase [Azoarcus communis]|uniref:GGDEF domain-containing protein n=1 Tax=Parazoarcus communis TaxID=41977 RepID=UPI0014596EEA|nr:diguanylate cyclase [Parazoarcus communis]NMG50825.1 diguanylate cyclase [Parazoarcus communis]
MNNLNPSEILLIEDSESFAAMLCEQLMQFGYRPLWRRNTDTLLEDLRDNPGITALICDVFLEEGSIGPLLERKKAAAGGSVLPPTIFISGHLDFMTRLQAARAGAVAFFPKPLDIGALVDCLERLIRPTTATPYDILVVDDDHAVAQYHASLLNHAGMTTRVLSDPTRVYDALLEREPDLLVLDMHMPVCSGVELAAVIRQDPRFVGLPIVFLSADHNIERRIGALSFGADDFLVKPIDPDFFVSSVSVRASRYREMRSQISQDSLTGLLNHTSIKRQLDIEIVRAQRSGRPVSFALLDLDHFKRVNDTFGHPVGDEVIRSLSRLLGQRLRQTDIAGRYGGEEFAVILPDTPLQDAGRLMDQLRLAFRQIVQHPVGKTFHCSLSCGIASFPAVPANHVISFADKALYESKRLGRDRVTLIGEKPVSAS